MDLNCSVHNRIHVACERTRSIKGTLVERELFVCLLPLRSCTRQRVESGPEICLCDGVFPCWRGVYRATKKREVEVLCMRIRRTLPRLLRCFNG
ncbi:hypothetical protein R1flu_020132 [Riccia fluitans]|uniref:Uncharacterized protein n=1 Tax=Riccia fluitans TaxID=41844 RepID=A0ABD1ZKN9_9MARC